MELVFENLYVSISLDAENSILADTWLTNSSSMSEEIFKDIMYVWRDIMQKNQIKYAFTDTLRFDFPLTPEIQDWVVENISGQLFKNFSFHKHAFIMPAEFIAGLGIEQLTDENNKKSAENAYFSDIASARKWLLS
ncbi:MAG: hypothetical protein EAZ07_10575 [Cytophagales bacterium]|nr:MAG: hypothetical protein EAZ20_01460 [Bacteroidota bacterium]TAH23540.1 MAG: hypothetical protein EAZ07_10575 [Cytophagales bacterium]